MFFKESKNKAEFEENDNKYNVLIGDEGNNDEEEDEMKENRIKLKKMKGKSENNNKKQRKNSKKQRHVSKVREQKEGDGVNGEDELSKSNQIESKLKKGYKWNAKIMRN